MLWIYLKKVPFHSKLIVETSQGEHSFNASLQEDLDTVYAKAV